MKDSDYKIIFLAGGCFWGTEHLMKQINGVVETQVGYANSNMPNPTYREVCSGETDAAECVKVVYDPKVITLSKLLSIFFLSIDPTSLNKQGGDCGTQYRTGIYYTDEADKRIIDSSVNDLSKEYSAPIVIEVEPLNNFFNAEDYHQDYLDNNPNGYCHIKPELFRLARQLN